MKNLNFLMLFIIMSCSVSAITQNNNTKVTDKNVESLKVLNLTKQVENNIANVIKNKNNLEFLIKKDTKINIASLPKFDFWSKKINLKVNSPSSKDIGIFGVYYNYKNGQLPYNSNYSGNWQSNFKDKMPLGVCGVKYPNTDFTGCFVTIGTCNNNYANPTITGIKSYAQGTTEGTIGSIFTLNGIHFGVGVFIKFSVLNSFPSETEVKIITEGGKHIKIILVDVRVDFKYEVCKTKDFASEVIALIDSKIITLRAQVAE